MQKEISCIQQNEDISQSEKFDFDQNLGYFFATEEEKETNSNQENSLSKFDFDKIPDKNVNKLLDSGH